MEVAIALLACGSRSYSLLEVNDAERDPAVHAVHLEHGPCLAVDTGRDDRGHRVQSQEHE